MSNSEIDWINETVSNTLSSSFLYENAQDGIDILTRFLAAEASDISSTFLEAKEWIKKMNNQFIAKEAKAVYKIDGIALVNCEIFEKFLETFRES